MSKNRRTKNIPAPVKNERNSSFEILRILAMLLIIAHHFVWYGGSMNISFDEGINRYIAQFLFIGGWLGVDIFFMISGYFSVDGQFRSKRIARLDATIIFYSLLFACISAFVLRRHVDFETWRGSFFPICMDTYWFMTIYVIVYLLSPYFNLLINKLSKKQFKTMVVICFFFACFIPIFRVKKPMGSFNNVFLTGIYGYFIGAYLKKCPVKFMDNIPSAAVFTVVTYTLLGLVSVYGYKYDGTNQHQIIVWLKNIQLTHSSLLMLFCAASFIMLFKNIKIGTVKWINFISRTVMGVYIIHEAPAIRDYIWRDIFKVYSVIRGDMYFLNAMRITLTLFAACCVIELVRIYVIEKNILKIKRFDGFFDKVDEFMNKISGDDEINEKTGKL